MIFSSDFALSIVNRILTWHNSSILGFKYKEESIMSDFYCLLERNSTARLFNGTLIQTKSEPNCIFKTYDFRALRQLIEQ